MKYQTVCWNKWKILCLSVSLKQSIVPISSFLPSVQYVCREFITFIHLKPTYDVWKHKYCYMLGRQIKSYMLSLMKHTVLLPW